ncbi:protein containing DUF214, permase predicted [Pseudovibrio sp. FO-BEG1]|jgi:putative ABC transport system permease protein|nr:FtsX-like permease family protein [Pseudovibrio denitrificans]AEV37830.1 protein containing DUF214, permase predicted [Pseudovibrio sp. FO-BEG1]
MMTISFAFAIFGLADAIDNAFSGGRDLSQTKRLITNHKVSMTNTMPIHYGDQIAQLDGVTMVTHATWYGGYYQDERNPVTVFAVDAQKYIEIFDELVFADEQKSAFLSNISGAAVGRAMADQQGWQLGDRVQIHSNIWRTKHDTNVWDFEILAIFEGEDTNTETNLFLIHHDGFDETRSYGNYSAGWFSIKVEPSDTKEQLAIAAEIDALFANSESETKTATEQSFLESFSNQYADIGLVLKMVMGTVVATLLIVCASTITQSARERQRDFAVLQTMGFRVPWISTWIALESFFTVLIGAVLGIVMAMLFAGRLKVVFTELIPEVTIGFGDLAFGLMISAGVGLLAAILPMFELSNTPIVKTLSRR